ncbi:MAG: hypothetical protein ACYDCM_14710 [Candidatus Acidiferrales bacterium]
MKKIRTKVRVALRLLALVVIASLPANGYEQFLTSESVREAFFLGQRRDEGTARFLAAYRHDFPLPKKGPHISRAQVLTPYAQIVLGSEDGAIQGTVMDAEREYQTQPSVFLVQLRVFATPTYYSASQLKELWEKLSIRVMQGKLLKPSKINYISRRFPGNRGPGGTDIELQFDVAQIASAPITIEVSSPDGQRIETKFDLGQLK